jgi:hypothetical protein
VGWEFAAVWCLGGGRERRVGREGLRRGESTLTDSNGETRDGYAGESVLDQIGPSGADQRRGLPVVGLVVGGSLEDWELEVCAWAHCDVGRSGVVGWWGE